MNPKKIELLERNFNLYWEGRPTEISDERFDKLMEELRREYPNHHLLNDLGLKTARGTEYIHKTPMLSLDKVYDFPSLQKWVKRVARGDGEVFLIQYKFDGLAGKYTNGILATRGNGKTGENISRQKGNIRLVQFNKKTSLLKPIQDEIIGEIIVDYNDFEKYKAALKQDFANPRNFVVGMVNRKDPLPSEIQLDFVEYETSFTRKMTAKEFENDKKWNKIVEEFQANKQYPTDGLVVKLENKFHYMSLGATEHHPIGAIAFKFYGETAWSKLNDVEWSHGKGCLTPVAIIDPVEVGGVTISRVTMHNAKFVLDKDIMIGDELEIERAGEVIPHVLNRKCGKTRKACIPNTCPTCGEELFYADPELVCTNPMCDGTKFEQFRTAIECFEIDGLGEKTIRHIFNMPEVKTPADVFKLTIQQISEIPGFQEISTKKLYDNIQKSKSMTPSTMLASINTPGVGKAMYAKILERIPFDKLMGGIDLEELATLPNVGEKRALAIKKSLRKNREYLLNLISIASVKTEEKKSGAKICFTGKMDKPRSFYQKLAKERGYNPVDSVTKDLDILVVSSLDWKSNKTETAKKLGVKIMELKDWENE